jgi:hypothetical protein
VCWELGRAVGQVHILVSCPPTTRLLFFRTTSYESQCTVSIDVINDICGMWRVSTWKGSMPSTRSPDRHLGQTDRTPQNSQRQQLKPARKSKYVHPEQQEGKGRKKRKVEVRHACSEIGAKKSIGSGAPQSASSHMISSTSSTSRGCESSPRD